MGFEWFVFFGFGGVFLVFFSLAVCGVWRCFFCFSATKRVVGRLGFVDYSF